ncbi:hypothetical protein [Methanosarcina siciliae]|uniref:hypothetical protein n=1 Tax=Methanosarcina siciliae TaxID=38027 RepID=UPI0016507EA7|nr:hypothetical protein [Methanosarcina siciliae]
MGSNFALLFSIPFWVIVFSVINTKVPFELVTSFAETQGIPPSQYSLTDVLGVPPLKRFAKSRIFPTSHPSGIFPNSESTILPPLDL